MRTPPFLLLGALLFWGWQNGNWIVGACLGVLLESIRFIPVRWELVEEDFRRICNFTALLVVAQVVLTYSLSNEGGNGSMRAAGATANSALTLLRWLPATLAVLVAAQNISQTGVVPLAAFFFSLRYRTLAGRRVINIGYPYFMVCLFSAGMHTNDGSHTFFFGFCILIAWALWPWRSRRFGVIIWFIAMLLAMVLGRLGSSGIGLMERYIEGYSGQWLVRMLQQHADPEQSRTSIGDIGRLKLSGRIVIRVTPKNGTLPPSYLREASYWHYRAQTWFTDATTNDFQSVISETTNGDSYLLVPGATNTSVATISSYLNGWSRLLSVSEGLLPLPSGTHRLTQLPFLADLKENHYGAVQADGPGLIIFDAHFGPGNTIDSQPGPGTNDFQIPTNEIPALTNVISQMHVDGLSDDRKLLAVQNFFSSNFKYATWQGPDKIPHTNNETSVGRFLLFSRSGHCEYFATATVLLLREMGIPARYAVGYAVHEIRGNGYVVRERDGHAWCLVWNSSKKVWQDFDTTPGSWIASEEERASPFERLSDFFSWLKFQFATFRYGQTQWHQYALWILAPMMAFLLYRVVFRRGRRRGQANDDAHKKAFADWPGLDSDFYRLEESLTAHGVPRQPAETLSDWLNRALADVALADLRQPLQDLLRLHYRYRFDPLGLDETSRLELRQRTAECLAALEKSQNPPDQNNAKHAT